MPGGGYSQETPPPGFFSNNKTVYPADTEDCIIDDPEAI